MCVAVCFKSVVNVDTNEATDTHKDSREGGRESNAAMQVHSESRMINEEGDNRPNLPRLPPAREGMSEAVREAHKLVDHVRDARPFLSTDAFTDR